MKFVNSMVLAASLMISASASAEVVAKCGDSTGELTQINIVEKADGSLVALMTVESFGGSFPTYRIPVTRAAIQPRGNSPYLEYVGKNFDLSIQLNTTPHNDGAYLSFLQSKLSSVKSIYCKLK